MSFQASPPHGAEETVADAVDDMYFVGRTMMRLSSFTVRAELVAYEVDERVDSRRKSRR